MEHDQPTQALPPVRDEDWPEPELEEVGGNGDRPTHSPQSALDAIKAQRAAQSETRTLDLPFPGSRGLIGLRLGPVPAAQLSRITERVVNSKDPERVFSANADILIAAHVAVLHRFSTEEPFSPLVDPVSGEPLRLGERLAELLDIKETRARGLIRALFDQANSPALAVQLAAGEYQEWAGSANEELDLEFVGESPAAP